MRVPWSGFETLAFATTLREDRTLAGDTPRLRRAFADVVEMPGSAALSRACRKLRAPAAQRSRNAFNEPLVNLRCSCCASCAYVMLLSLLETQALAVDQVAQAVGYKSRSSWLIRAALFR